MRLPWSLRVYCLADQITVELNRAHKFGHVQLEVACVSEPPGPRSAKGCHGTRTRSLEYSKRLGYSLGPLDLVGLVLETYWLLPALYFEIALTVLGGNVIQRMGCRPSTPKGELSLKCSF